MILNWHVCVIAAFLLVANFHLVAARELAFLRRDGPGASVVSSLPQSTQPTPTSSDPKAAATASAASATQASASASASASPQSKAANTHGSSKPTNSAAASDGVVLTAAASPTSNASFVGNITNTVHIQGLPVHPEVTPALAVAGALLILSGAIYTLIGIKTKWLHIFCSTAYLFSLCVVVLIVYVMNPPIPNGIQGAYFVAAAATGMVFGAIAVIFADVTEGLGCFLGGFCLGMWFLVLKPDGLIASQAGKSIFLGCFTVGTFALYISHYTRPYGLIGATSFAGATAVLLGVDMFSRAGLKEFWLYIWGLNDDLFPLHYNGPYPITRGMRVEIACIVMFCLLGVMSQMKVWNIIKARREQRAAEQRRKDSLQDQAEAELGRRVEDNNERDRNAWDAVYNSGDKQNGLHTDSAFSTSQASTRKGSVSIVDVREVGSIELQPVRSGSSSMKRGIVTVNVASDEAAPLPSPSDSKPVHSKAVTAIEPSIDEPDTGRAKSGTPEPVSGNEMTSAPKSLPFIDPNLSLKPKFTPLPFQVPTGATMQEHHEDDKSSVATFAASDRVPDAKSSKAKRLSGSSLVRKLSGRSKQSPVGPTSSQEALVAHQSHSRASSVAVTVDEISIQSLSRENLASGNQTPKSSAARSMYSEPASTRDMLGLDHAKIDTATFEYKSPRNDQPDRNLEVGTAQAVQDAPESTPQSEIALPNKSELGPEKARDSLIAGNLPDTPSRVVMTYRTNEWAKHLSNAESPPVEEPESGKQPLTSVPERSAPVNVQELQQTAMTAVPASVTATAPSSVGENAGPASAPDSKTSSPQLSPSASRTNLAGPTHGSSSQVSMRSVRTNDASRPMPRTRLSSSSLTRGLRSSSTPLVSSPLAEPIAEDRESSFPNRFTPSPLHLMSQRESTIQSRPGSTSFNRSSGSLNRSYSQTSLAQIYEDGPADDDMPLAQRKSMLQQSQPSLTPPQRSLSASPPSTSPYGTPLNLSRNPSRLSLAGARPIQSAAYSTSGPSDKHNSTVSAWRSSLANDPSYENARETADIEQRRSAMSQEKQMARNSKAVEMMQEQARKSVLDKEMIRRGSGMMEAHREAMRKMQGSVNEKLKQNGG